MPSIFTSWHGARTSKSCPAPTSAALSQTRPANRTRHRLRCGNPLTPRGTRPWCTPPGSPRAPARSQEPVGRDSLLDAAQVHPCGCHLFLLVLQSHHAELHRPHLSVAVAVEQTADERTSSVDRAQVVFVEEDARSVLPIQHVAR